MKTYARELVKDTNGNITTGLGSFGIVQIDRRLNAQNVCDTAEIVMRERNWEGFVIFECNCLLDQKYRLLYSTHDIENESEQFTY